MNKRFIPLFAVILLILILLLQACAPASRTGLTDLEKQEMLAAHNQWRTAVGVAPVTWSDTVAAVAQQWAVTLAAQGGQLQHSQGNGYGENLFGGSAKTYTPTDAVNSWGSEQQAYHGEAIDNQNYLTFGHYTQMVWRDTTEIGCGMATSAKGSEVWVCNYNPPGNMIGQTPY